MEILRNFLVLEGLDGAGTTTQLKLAAQRLERTGIPHFQTFEPTDSATGQMIRKILKGDENATPWTIALLFSADRWEHIFHTETGIKAHHERGEIIICDRYLFSSLAYQSIENDYDRIFRLNQDFPLPGHLVFIDTPLEVCQERLSGRDQKDIFEKMEFQKNVRDNYHKILDQYRHSGMKITKIDGTLPIGEVENIVWKIVSSLPIYKE
jgi:dTMP kinase